MRWGRPPAVWLGGGTWNRRREARRGVPTFSFPGSEKGGRSLGRAPRRPGGCRVPPRTPETSGALLSGRAGGASLDAGAAARGLPPSLAAPSPAGHGLRKPPTPALSSPGRGLRAWIGFSSFCHLPQREGRQGDRQGSGGEAPSSLRQPHPSDHVHL